jgi:hypothetical protein
MRRSLISFLLLAAAVQAVPTFSPTTIPTSVEEAEAVSIAMHQLVVVANAGDSLVRLKSFDLDSFNVSAVLTAHIFRP